MSGDTNTLSATNLEVGTFYSFEKEITVNSVPKEKLCRAPGLDRREAERKFIGAWLHEEGDNEYEFKGHKVKNGHSNDKIYHFRIKKEEALRLVKQKK